MSTPVRLYRKRRIKSILPGPRPRIPLPPPSPARPGAGAAAGGAAGRKRHGGGATGRGSGRRRPGFIVPFKRLKGVAPNGWFIREISIKMVDDMGVTPILGKLHGGWEKMRRERNSGIEWAIGGYTLIHRSTTILVLSGWVQKQG